MFRINTLILQRYLRESVKQTKRNAGHNKWSNIRHIKAEKDSEKSVMYLQVGLRIKSAASEGGINPETNDKLARILEYAKKINMPRATITNMLEKLKVSQENKKLTLVDIRGPGGSAFVAYVVTDNMVQFKLQMTGRVKKCGGKFSDPSIRRMFDHKGVVTTEATCSFDKAMEDAINVEAEDVEENEFENIKQYKFKCEPSMLNKLKTKLEGLNYSIVTVEEVCEPNVYIELNEENMYLAEKLRAKLLESEEVQQVVDNVQHSS